MVRRALSDESGQVTAYFVAIMIVLFGLMALAIDMGFFFHARRVAQNAADPAALAGAAYLDGCPLADGSTDPLDVAQDYAGRNLTGKTFSAGADTILPEQRTLTVDDTDLDTVYVRVTRPQRYVLGQILPGLAGQFVGVPAEAEAVCAAPEQLAVCPFYIQAPDINDPTFGLEAVDPENDIYPIYRFKFDSDDGHHGNRGFLDLFDDPLKDVIAQGCQGDGGPQYEVNENDPEAVDVESKPGNVASVWKNGFDEFYDYEEDMYGDEFYCNISFDEDDFPADAPYDFTLNAPDPDEAAEKLAECMVTPEDRDGVVYGRYFPIILSDTLVNEDCTGTCTLTTDRIAMMYVVCWGGGKNPCSSANPGAGDLYGMFVDSFTFDINGDGIGTNPLLPKRVVFIR